MPSPEPNKTCLACNRSDQETPLVCLDYQNTRFWICPQHLPLLIHHPQRLIGLLPGAEHLRPADHHD